MLLLAEMSSAGSIAMLEHTTLALEMARKHRDFVVGFVANGTLPGQKRSEDEDF
jgi:orotidine-5'-phosphate decarboxylase